MKLKKDLVLRNVAGNWVVLPLAAATVDLNGMIKLNESGAMLWKLLEQGSDADTMADLLIRVYDVSREEALSDANEFIGKLLSAGCLEE